MNDLALRIGSTLAVAGGLASFSWLRFGLGPALGVFVVALGVGLLAGLAPVLRRARVARAPFPVRYRAVLERDVHVYRALAPTERARFEQNVAIFLGEQSVTGPRGEVLDDELRVLVAASAVIVVFGRPGFHYPTTRDVIVYDDAFDESYEVGGRKNFLGMVHGSGPILLSGRALRQGFIDPRDGHNVGLHEFAHVLDFDAGQADGIPSFMPWRAVKPWLRVMHDETKRIRRHHSILRDYAATNDAEFFAVATEMFFEQPQRMREKHAALYALLRTTYGQDPAHVRPIVTPTAASPSPDASSTVESIARSDVER